MMSTHVLRRRRYLVPLALVAGIALVFAAAASYLAYRIDLGAFRPNRSAPGYPLAVTAFGGGQITITGDDADLARPGIYGLAWDGGYGQINEIVSVDAPGEAVTRMFTAINGTPAVGGRVRLDNFAFPGDPRARGVPFVDVTYPAPLGPMPAWLTAGTSKTWAIFVHGKGSDRGEALRILPTLASLQLPTLVITYRNDAAAPGGQSGRYAYGETEWADLQAAVQYALDSGASHVVLIGYSMGGGIVANFMQRSPLASHVAGLILDAPMLDLIPTVDLGLREGGVPGWFTAPPRWFASLLYHVDWSGADYLKDTRWLRVPLLLFHTSGDDVVPVSTSDQLASARPDEVRYVRTTGSGHVHSWNLDPSQYESAVQRFVHDTLGD